MDKKKPLWLLDVDGVINATSMCVASHIYPLASWQRLHVDGFQITAAKPVLDLLHMVHDDGLAEIRWHTTWQDRAWDVGEALGLPEFPVQYTDEWPDSSEKAARRMMVGLPRWWKVRAVYDLLGEGHRVLWTDDDIFPELPAVHRQKLKTLGKVRMLSPVSLYGIQPGEIRMIKRFLKELNR
jgi:hypothetical protein